jgi:hypothetical protein
MLKTRYNKPMMTTQYRAREIKEFAEFCKRHGIRFNNMVEYYSAIAQYFKKD